MYFFIMDNYGTIIQHSFKYMKKPSEIFVLSIWNSIWIETWQYVGGGVERKEVRMFLSEFSSDSSLLSQVKKLY